MGFVVKCGGGKAAYNLRLNLFFTEGVSQDCDIHNCFLGERGKLRGLGKDWSWANALHPPGCGQSSGEAFCPWRVKPL